MSKKFLTYNQQMKCLRDKNINCNGSPAKTLLCRQGYFNLINGYKTPFTCGKSQNGDNLYINGTSIYHFSLLEFSLKKPSSAWYKNLFHSPIRCPPIKHSGRPASSLR